MKNEETTSERSAISGPQPSERSQTMEALRAMESGVLGHGPGSNRGEQYGTMDERIADRRDSMKSSAHSTHSSVESMDSEAMEAQRLKYIANKTPHNRISLVDMGDPLNDKEKANAESAAGMDIGVQILIYTLAVALLVVVLVSPSLKKHDNGHGDHHSGQYVMRTIAYSVVSAGSLAYLCHLLKQPILLGYLLGGVLIGPIGLRIIISEHEIHTLSELGLIFLMFMIGLELNLSELMQMGQQVFVAGFLQFPACTALHYGIFQLLASAGVSVGGGKFAILYMSVCCALSSTMIVAKLLQGKQETETHAGKVTIGILIFQDLWAIVFLAVQPNMANPNIMQLGRTFLCMGFLAAVAFCYSKYVLPPVLKSASAASELLLVLSLTWCFFVCCVALLDWVNLSMELAALIAGISMASFPYSVELNAKIKYIRDFFITLYFVALGMQIPIPTVHVICMACVVVCVVLLVRWFGVFCVLQGLECGERSACLATINLSQIGEFALVIVALGMTFKHVEGETLTILIWAFAILAVLASYLIGYNDEIYKSLFDVEETAEGGPGADAALEAGEAGEIEAHEREIVMLGCFKVGWAMIDELERRKPGLLKRMVVIDFNGQHKEFYESKGIAFSYGDISSADVLAHHVNAKMVISTIPDAMLRGVNNKRLIEISKEVWPECQAVGIAHSTDDADEIYRAGADYVLMITKLGAERLADILVKTPADLDLVNALQNLKGSDNPYLRRMGAKEQKGRSII